MHAAGAVRCGAADRPGRAEAGDMAGGFFKGLVHGTLMCGAALAALSLAVPAERTTRRSSAGTNVVRVPVQDATATDATGSTAPEVFASQNVTPADDQPALADAPDAPAAAVLPLPVGSEFARGTDIQPSVPQPLQAPAPAMQAGPPVAVLPTAEPAPALAAALSSAAADQPAAPPREAAAPASPQAPAPVADEPDLPHAPTPEAAIPVPPPGKVLTPALDRRPELAGPPDFTAGGAGQSEPSAAIPNAPTDAPDPVAAAPAATALNAVGAEADAAAPDRAAPATENSAPVTAPALPSPGLDLSTPPDLTDLRAMERD